MAGDVIDLAENQSGQSGMLRLAIESMAQGLFMLDSRQRIIVLNRRFLDIYDLPAAVIKVGATAADIIEASFRAGNYPGITLEQAWSQASARLASKLPWRVEQRLRNGKVVAIAFAPMQGGGWVTTHLDVTEKRDAEDRLAYLASHDALTGLPNRTVVEETLASHIQARSRFAVLFMDLDRFKAVNDNLGHAAGDELLRQSAHRLVAACPQGALVARLGGDEFLVQFAADRPRDVAPEVAAAVLKALHLPFSLAGQQVRIGVSVGIAVAPTDGDTPGTLIDKADLALYRAKNSGRGAFSFYEPGMRGDILPAALAPDLRRALSAEAAAGSTLALLYQPIMNADGLNAVGMNADGTGVAAFEAELQWRHPVHGLIPSAMVRSIAAKSALAGPLARWMLRQACTAAAAWPAHIGLTMDLLCWELDEPDLVGAVAHALDDAGLAPHRLTLELSEAMVLRDGASHHQAVCALRSLGVRICLDGFGAETASLGSLLTLPFDAVKVAAALVAGSTASSAHAAVIRAVTGLATSLGLSAGAEGVATAEQLVLLRDGGVRHVQGPLFGAPVSPAGVGAMVR